VQTRQSPGFRKRPGRAVLLKAVGEQYYLNPVQLPITSMHGRAQQRNSLVKALFNGSIILCCTRKSLPKELMRG
jgi:nicotinate-nucleotide pyrophosphorylase